MRSCLFASCCLKRHYYGYEIDLITKTIMKKSRPCYGDMVCLKAGSQGHKYWNVITYMSKGCGALPVGMSNYVIYVQNQLGS